jgi:hypothetical protein
MNTALSLALEAAAAVWAYTEIRRWLIDYVAHMVDGDAAANQQIALAMAAHGRRRGVAAG